MSYSLHNLATRSRDFRAIRPTGTQEAELLRLYMPILQAWRDSAAASMSLYAARDTDGVQSQDKRTAEEVAALLLAIRFAPYFASVEKWHRSKWLASVSHATGVDAKWMTQPHTPSATAGNRAMRRATGSRGVVASSRVVAPVAADASIDTTVANAVASAVTQARSLSEEARARVANALLGGMRSNTPATDVARGINEGLARSRRRAIGIADNELDNAVKGMTSARMAEAGLDFGKWSHLAGQKHPRPEHAARDGELYRADDKVWSELLLPFCHCTKVPVLKIGKFSGV